ncbi:transposase [Streptomyces canus]
MGERRLPHHRHRPRRLPRHRRPPPSTAPPGARGFTIIPRRWTIERSIGWLMHHRRLARDYERHPYRSEVMLHLAMIGLTARRLPGEAFPTWRGT